MSATPPFLANSLRSQVPYLAERIVEMVYARQPDIWKPYGHPGREKSVRDAGYHLSFLAEAVEANDPTLFTEYLGWVKIIFAGLNFPEEVLSTTLDCTRKVLIEKYNVHVRDQALEFIDLGIASLPDAPLIIPSYIEGHATLDELTRQYLDALLADDRETASQLILESVHDGVAIQDIYLIVFQRSQREIGRLWQTNRISVAQEHFCTAATQMIMSQLYPLIFSGERKCRTLVAACVGGDLHEIGARMVADFFEMAGWDTFFLGANTPSEMIIKTVEEKKADILALSATMTFHVGKVSVLIKRLRENGNCSKTKVLVGGYPFNLSTELWMRVGADGYAPDAKTALQEAERMLLS